MSSSFRSCPNCGRKPSGGLLGGSWFDVYRCRECKHRFCFKCDGSLQGRKCPECGSTSRETVGQVSL